MRRYELRRTASGRRDALILGFGGVLAAIIAWLAMILVARVAGPEVYEDFVVVWSMYFAVAGVLLGLQQQTIRALRLHREPVPSHTGPASSNSARIQAFGLRTGLVTLPLAVLVFSTAIRPTGTGLAVLIVVVTCGTLGLVSTIVSQGVFAADGRWPSLARLAVVEQVVRLMAITAVALLYPEPLGFVIAVYAGLMVYGPSVFSTCSRRLPPDQEFVFVKRAIAAMVTTGCASVLVVGLPSLVAMTGDTPPQVTASLFGAIYLTRSPILVPVNALRPIILRLLLDRRQQLVREVAGRAAPVFVLCLILAAIFGWLLGPVVLRVVLGAEFVLTREVMAALTAAAVLMLGLTLSGVAVVAIGDDAGATAGWVSAVAITVGILLLPLDITERCVAAMVSGPCLGMLIHLWRLVTVTSTAPYAAPGDPPHGDEAQPPTDDAHR